MTFTARLWRGLLGALLLATAWAASGYFVFRFLREDARVALVVALFAAGFIARIFRMGVWSAVLGFLGFHAAVAVMVWNRSGWTVAGINLAPGFDLNALLRTTLHAAVFVSPAVLEAVVRSLHERKDLPRRLA